MEDEETGEFFIPCRECSQKCYIKHGKYHEKECCDDSPSFFKVMLADFAEKLRIPPAFVSRFSNDPDEHMVLEGPDGQKWDVQLWGSINQLEFRQGWKNYVDFHGLEMGDFLVFDYISKSYFKVKIYDRTACEKKLNARHFMNSNVDSPSDKVGSSSRRFWSIKMKSRNESFGQLCLLEFPKIGECPLEFPRERSIVVLVDKNGKE
ncbi:hypothetical protein SUGI_0774410 [Cryptomeria japonica]|nr:hypothetical protein SUGI_0774410 [Cryptomeria japonica]